MMEKTIFEQMVGTYEQQSNYFIIVTHKKLKPESRVFQPRPPVFCLEKQRKHRRNREKTVTCCLLASIVRKPFPTIFTKSY